MSYRHDARNALDYAKQELASGEKHRFRYAALELRMAFEALIYERAGNYTEELSNEKLSTWQPGKLLSLLLEIDPSADKNCGLSVGIEEEYGKPAKEMTYMGEERVIKLSEIKKYYDRLGSYLHTLTSDQVAEGKGADLEKIFSRCNEIVAILEQVLASPIFNLNMKIASSMDCIKCGAKIVRRLPPESETVVAKCIKCSASYSVTDLGNNKVEWRAHIQKLKCPSPSCDGTNEIWESDIKVGSEWECVICGVKNKLVLALAI